MCFGGEHREPRAWEPPEETACPVTESGSLSPSAETAASHVLPPSSSGDTGLSVAFLPERGHCYKADAELCAQGPSQTMQSLSFVAERVAEVHQVAQSTG